MKLQANRKLNNFCLWGYFLLLSLWLLCSSTAGPGTLVPIFVVISIFGMAQLAFGPPLWRAVGLTFILFGVMLAIIDWRAGQKRYQDILRAAQKSQHVEELP